MRMEIRNLRNLSENAVPHLSTMEVGDLYRQFETIKKSVLVIKSESDDGNVNPAGS